MDEIKFDKRNYRKHGDANKRVINKSLKELGAGRSILIDGDNGIIAGNGVYEQAQKLGIPVRVVETNGDELIAVKRTDLGSDDDRRARLALADNAASDMSEWDIDLLREDWTKDALADFGVELPDFDVQKDEIEREKREFEERMACGELSEEDEEYQNFVNKFVRKKTTDDCYTPPIIYDAVADWVANEYGLDKACFVRPFYPGGDYQNEKYNAGDVVVDNPPFSILAEIIRFYTERNIRYFLFVPHLTLFSSSSSSSSSTALVTGISITYENGAIVNTSFRTNLEPQEIQFRSCPTLYETIKNANDKNLKSMRKELPRYMYDLHVVSSTMIAPYSRLGIDFVVLRNEAYWIAGLDAQKEAGKTIFGCGYLISDRLCAEREKAEREKAEREKAGRWMLSPRELGIIKSLNNNA